MSRLPRHQTWFAGKWDTVVRRSRSVRRYHQWHVLEGDFDDDTFMDLVSYSSKLAVTKFNVDVVIK
jgi:hypothetical protein